MLRKKFQAFTVVELMVGLAMTSILLLAGFFGYQLIQKQYQLYRQTSEVISITQGFQYLLESTVRKSTLVKVSGNEIVCVFPEREKIFSLNENEILLSDTRSIDRIDTIALQIKIEEVKFRGTSIAYGRADEISLVLFPFEEAVPFTVRKRYSAADIVKY